jgi:hypothetical protein
MWGVGIKGKIVKERDANDAHFIYVLLFLDIISPHNSPKKEK